MHAVLTITLMHDRHVSGRAHTPLSVTEAYHWQQGLQLYIRKLSGPLKPADVDCVWATGAIMCVTAFSHIEANTPQEAWPLKSPSPLDLNWLKMSEGKKQFLQRMQRINTNSAVGSLFTQENIRELLAEIAPPSGLDALPYELIILCGLDAPVLDPDENPYYFAASSLAQILNSEKKHEIVLNYVGFLMSMPPQFRRLLEIKDPRSLLLLAYWYAKHIQYPHWWIYRRAKLECQAICIYLESYYWENTAIQSLLQYPQLISADSAR